MSSSPETLDPDRSRRRRLVLAAAAAALVIVVVVALVIWSRRDEPAAAPVVDPTTAAPSVSMTPRPPATSSPQASTPGAAPVSATSTQSPAPTSSAATTKPVPPTAPPESSNQKTRTPVPLDEDTEVEVEPGVKAKVDRLTAVTGEAEGPGEVGGPAVRFRVVLTNDSSAEVPLISTVVNLYSSADKTPANPVSGPGASALPESVAPGGSASGTYVFVLPRDERDRVLITVDYAVDRSVVAFQGRAPR